MKKILLLMFTLLVVGGVKAENREIKTPIKLTGATNSPTIEPIAPSTLDNLYAATFTPTADYSNIFKITNLDVREYEKIVIKFGSPVSGNWNINKPDKSFSTIPAGSEDIEIDVRDYATYSDFTIFNWAGERTPIIITEAYFVKTLEVIQTTDYTSIDTYNMWHGTIPDGGALEKSGADNALKIVNPSKLDGNWRFQYIIADGITTVAEEDYLVSITLKSNVAGKVNCSFGGWNGLDQSKEFDIEVGDEWVTKEVTFSFFPYSLDASAHVLMQSGNLAGTILVQKVEVIRVPNLCNIAKPTRTATDAKTDVFAGFKTIDGDATWDAETRLFTRTCGWQWDGDGIDLSQYRYLVITAGRNSNTDGTTGLQWNYGVVSIKDKNNVEVSGDDYGAPYMNMYFSVWNNHNCLKIDLEKLRAEKWFDIYHVKELKIFGDAGFILGNVYATNQAPENNKNWGGEDNGDYKVENLPADKFGTICLSWKAAVAGAFVYEIVGKFGEGIALRRVDGLMEAGKPYIYKSNAGLKEATTGTATNNNVYFYKATAATVEEPVENNGLIGTFTEKKVPSGDDIYVVGRAANATEDKLYQVDVENSVTWGANRAYIDRSKINKVAASSRTILLGFDGVEENESTAIESTEAVEVLNEAVFYDMSGREVKNPTTGIYIVKYGDVTKKVMINK